MTGVIIPELISQQQQQQPPPLQQRVGDPDEFSYPKVNTLAINAASAQNVSNGSDILI